ncbi:M56 family metallopeptidase [Joostella sp. CR20]|uniref:M56 family metallopeptidase n=1 Tax=Joostella sp. CR20 TaxID=2804312 RepID=UPI00313DFA93
METFLIYLIKASGVLTLFWLVYQIVLKRETFFTANRWFLNAGLIVSILLPLLYFKTVKVIEVPANLNFAINETSAVNIETVSWQTQLLTFALYTYVVGVVFFSIKFIVQLISLYRFINKGTTQKEGFNYVLTNEDLSPFSFFNYIVYNPSIYKGDELKTILTHEKIHAKQFHSLDVILLHLYTIVFWINPIVWLYKKVLTQNLEYITDHQTTKELNSTKEYQYLLLKQLSGIPYSVSNPFYNSLIKKRIVMLQKQQSNSKSAWKYALILPLLAGFTFAFNVKTIAQTKQIVIEEKSPASEITSTAAHKTQSITSDGTDPIYVLNGKIITREQLESVDPNTIESINVLKDENAIKKYGEKAKDGVVEINLKDKSDTSKNNVEEVTKVGDYEISFSSNVITPTQLIILDGKEISFEEFNNIDPEKIDIVSVFKTDAAVEKYGEKGKNGVIVIQTKK